MTRQPASEALGLRFDRLSVAARVALALSIAALWLLGRRYQGLAHDAILYLGIGLRRLDPAAFDGDPFFLHGAQDAYTLFPPLYAGLIHMLGAGGAALALTVMGQVAFAGAAAALVWRLAPPPVRWWSMAVLAVVSGYYGGVGVFRIAEPFATARTLAEPLVVLALACTLGARRGVAVALIVAALLLHPLVALPGIAAVILWHALASPVARRLVLPAILLAMCVLSAISWWPGARFDEAWMDPVRQRSPHLFLAEWLAPDWARLGWGFCVASIAAPVMGAAARRMLGATVAVLLAALACSAIAVDILGNAFIASLQLWRAHWLLHLLALVLVPVVAAALWPRGTSARAGVICLVASLCFGRFGQPAALALSVLAVVFAELARRGISIGETALRAVTVGASGLAAVGLLFAAQERLPLAYASIAEPGWKSYIEAATSLGGLLPLGAVLLLLAHTRRTGIALAAALATLAIGVAVWDARTPWRRFLEEAHARSNPFRMALAGAGPVFWAAPGVPAWTLLGRPSWFSVDQGAGIVFSRSAALDYAVREGLTRRLRAADTDCAMTAPRPCRIDAAAAREVCATAGGPDYLVVSAPITGIPGVPWRVPAESQSGARLLLLYECARFRAGK